MDNLEKYIKENKARLEPNGVDQKVWLSIENAMLKDKHKHSKTKINYLGLFMLLFIGALIFMMNSNSQKRLDEERIIADLNLSQYNFTEQIQDKKLQLVKATVPQDKLEDFQILLQQLEFMDGQFQDYRLYIEQNGYQEFIGDQILNFYKTKIELLDKIQHEVEKINYYERIEPSVSAKVNLEI